MVLLITAVLFAFFGLSCRSRLARTLLWAGAGVALLAALAFYWVPGHLEALQASAASGQTPSESGLLTRIALAHVSFANFVLVSGIFTAPTVVLLATWLEYRHRRQQKAG